MEDFATEVAGKLFDLKADVVVLFLVLSFGFAGSPGEYQILANAAKQFIRCHRPDLPEWHGDWALVAWFLVDDLVQAIVCLGRLPWLAERVSTRVIELVFGDRAIHAKKADDEGRWGTRHIIRGLWMDTVARTVALPELKLLKAFYGLNDAALDEGSRT